MHDALQVFLLIYSPSTKKFYYSTLQDFLSFNRTCIVTRNPNDYYVIYDFNGLEELKKNFQYLFSIVGAFLPEIDMSSLTVDQLLECPGDKLLRG